MKKAVIYFWNEVMKKEKTYRIENFDLHVREDLEGLANTGTLAQKQYPFPIMEKPEISCRMFVDHAGANYWKVREQMCIRDRYILQFFFCQISGDQRRIL